MNLKNYLFKELRNRLVKEKFHSHKQNIFPFVLY
jgi:hypothetical protein